MDLKAAAQERFEGDRKSLIDLSHRIHAHPELGFEEEKACAWLCEVLADNGFAIEKGVGDLPTAFRASAGRGPLHIAICAEYDSPPCHCESRLLRRTISWLEAFEEAVLRSRRMRTFAACAGPQAPWITAG